MPRPKEFEPEVALDRAMHVFWEKGYQGASLSALQRAMKVNRFSMYSTFGAKRDLFLAALDLYGTRYADERFRYLEAGPGGLEPIRDFLQSFVRNAERRVRIGCLMANTAMELATTDRKAAARVRRYFDRLDRAFLTSLRRAGESGELKAASDLEERARFLGSCVRGLIVEVKMGAKPAQVDRTVGFTLRLIDSW